MLRPLVIALSFLTRLPIDAGAVEPREVGRAVACFPLVGLLLGAASYVLGWLALPVLGAALSAALVVALLALATGGLHLDGLADLFDGLGGARGDRERALTIMRDSRIGSHGATALGLVLLAKVLALEQLLSHQLAWPLLAAPACARCAAVPLIAYFPYARESGLGRMFSEQTRTPHVALALLLTAAALAVLGLPALVAAPGALGLALGLGLVVNRKLRGLTGDVYGASIELAELGYLLAVVALQHAGG